MKEEWKILLEVLYEIVNYLEFTVECPADSEYLNSIRRKIEQLSSKVLTENEAR